MAANKFTVCERELCAGCKACVDICPQKAIKIVDTLKAYNAVIDRERCINCNMCREVCSRNEPLDAVSPISWMWGWAYDDEIRARGSAGGTAAALAEAFLEDGGIVYACTFSNGKFVFDRVNGLGDFKRFQGAMFIKSDPEGVYQRISKDLRGGKRVLFIGLPCQVAGVKRFLPDEGDQLVTVDLICHGTASPQLLGMFLDEYGSDLEKVPGISFTDKDVHQIQLPENRIVRKGVVDRFSLANDNGLIYTQCCYACRYADEKRVSDITLGYGSVCDLPSDKCEKGVSLILCQTNAGMGLLEQAKLVLNDADSEKVLKTEPDLFQLTLLPPERKIFFDELSKSAFGAAVSKVLPKQCKKQDAAAIFAAIRKNK